MSLSALDTARLLFALSILLVAAHGLGFVAARLRQPRVIGEILGGLLLGPTVLGAALPEVQRWIFHEGRATPPVLGAVFQIGLLLLMFLSGIEVRSAFDRKERRASIIIAIVGTLLPFGVGILFLETIDAGRYLGAADDPNAFLLVFAIALSVTSIPVISRIMLDLGILETSFGRVVLATAVIEDVFLYVVLAVALGMVGVHAGEPFGLPALLEAQTKIDPGLAYHVCATLAFFATCLGLGPRLLRRLLRWRYNLVQRGSPVAFQLVFLMATTALGLALGLAPMFGAFVAGLVIGTAEAEAPGPARESIRGFAFAFFIPAYFASVGLRLDLLGSFDLGFFAAFFVFACVAKSLAVYAGAFTAGESPWGARNLAVAMNCRGGPGIVLASVALDAAIINGEFYACLVLLALLTSVMAGAWLSRVVASGTELR